MNQKLIKQFISYIDKERKFSKHTIRSYQNDLEQFNDFLSKYDKKLTFLSIDKTAIQFYIQKCSKKNVSDKTLLRKVSTIKSFFKYLTNIQLINYNISKLIDSPKISKKIPHYLSKNKIQELMSLPNLSLKEGIMHKSILELFYSSGLRISELVKIKRVDLNLDKSILKILGKGDKERIVIIGKIALESIKNYLRVCKNSDNIYLYPSSNKMNSHVSVSYIYKMVKRYLVKVTNDEKMSPHSLRHSFATHLLDNGADLMSVKELLGHEDLSSTQIYTHISIDKMKKIYKQSHPHGK
ncbi:MAG: site-specific tyrosine recombinase XerD [Candidatus Marinimicrobia bacterium]|nr:site-specific tyrosine recombinase XerD [Candidatus Neomarinimicrobiota bacterium]|tara:strand:- start:21590 stop:22477 length:888 start_codon:yes stop_codon:yes gene_type:complete